MKNTQTANTGNKVMRKVKGTWVAVALMGLIGFATPSQASAAESTFEGKASIEGTELVQSAASEAFAEVSTSWVANGSVEVSKEVASQREKGLGAYVVQWGDTLSVLAEIAGTDVDTLAAANGIVNKDLILVGDLLVNVLNTNAVAPVETAKPVESKPVESKPVESKPVESKPVESKPVESKPVESKPVESKPVESKPVESKPVESKPVESKPVETKPEETKPVESKPVESKPVETKPEETKPVESKPVESKPEETKPEETKPEETKPVEEEPETPVKPEVPVTPEVPETPVTPETPVAKTYTIEHKNGAAVSSEKVISEVNTGESYVETALTEVRNEYLIGRFDLIKEYKNEKGQTVKEYIGEDKANIIPIGEIIKYDNTVEKDKRITTGKRVNGLSHYETKEVFVNGDVVSVDVITHINVEPQFPTVIVGTMEKTTVKQVTTTTPIIAGKVVTEDPTKSASESFNQEGTNGSIVEVVEVTYFNDKETGRKVLSSTTTPATYGKQLIGTK